MRNVRDRLLSAALVALCAWQGERSLLAGPGEGPALPPASIASFREGALQSGLEKVAGLRAARGTPLTKVYAQLLWTVLGVAAPSAGLAVGRDRELYGRHSVQEYCTSWPALSTSGDELREFAADIAEVSARLRALGRGFVVVVTPSKAAVLPAALPHFQCEEGEAKNRVPPRLTRALREAGVPLVDGATLVKRAAERSAVPLFPRYGIHWNAVGAYPTVVEALRLEARQLGDPPPRFELRDVKLVDEPPGDVTERDTLMNLYFGPRERVPNARFSIEPTGSRRRATFVGDSFSQAMIEVLEAARVFSSIERFNYLTEFHYSYPGGLRAENLRVDDIDWAGDVFGSDVVILEISEMLDLPPFARTFATEALRRLPASRTSRRDAARP